MITISKSRSDTHVMSLSELSRLLNIPVSRMKRALAQGSIESCGHIGPSGIVALTDDELETLRAQFHPVAKSPRS